MKVELEAAAEALNHCHRAGPAVLDVVRPRGAGVEGEQHARIHAQHRTAQGVIPRESVAQAIRQRQDPLAHRASEVQSLTKLMLSMNDAPWAKEILTSMEVRGFVAPDPKGYQDLRDWIK